jgi:two-component system, chemotaxis family, sensor kinase CheA
MSIDMSQFYQAFFEEAEELLAQAEHLLLKVDLESPDPEDLNAIFRAAHSIKGGAATFGMTDMAEITHVLENLLDKIRKNEMALTAEHVDVFLAAKDVLSSQLDGHRSNTEVDRSVEEQVKVRLKAFSDGASLPPLKVAEVAAPEVEVPVAAAVAAPAPVAAIADGLHDYRIEVANLADKDVVNLNDELSLLGDISYSKLPNGHVLFSLQSEDSTDNIISICSFIVEPEDITIVEANAAAPAVVAAPVVDTGIIEDEGFGLFAPIEPPVAKVEPEVVAAKAAEKAPVKAEAAKAAPARKEADKAAATTQENTSIRVGIEKVDQLINLVGELVITQAMIEQRVGKLDPIENEDLVNSIGQLTRNTRDLQEAVMSIRMMPMDYVFSRFPRMVRDLAARLNKKVEFVTNGAATELDKGLIERIIDPLTHLVRNSIDHGIEIPEARREKGKSETGRLSLSASNRGGNIVVEVTDDGAGLNRERILEKARQNGLPVTEGMPDNEVWQLIFAPGFSTADVVTDVSGRGVGMDVVKRNVSAMGGSIDIKSALGFGTTMSISLPLTLAILDGMSVSLGQNVYVVPLNLIVETMQPRMEDIKTVTGEGLMIHVRGEYLPIIPLYALFNQDTEIMHPTEGVLVILEAEGKKAALFVDGLVGQQQVVIKSLETNFKKIQGVSGATIMGDGSVALILDVPAIIKMGQNNTNSLGVFQ